jgi:hypothetical protein
MRAGIINARSIKRYQKDGRETSKNPIRIKLMEMGHQEELIKTHANPTVMNTVDLYWKYL